MVLVSRAGRIRLKYDQKTAEVEPGSHFAHHSILICCLITTYLASIVLEVEEDMKEAMLKSIRGPLEQAGVLIKDQFDGIEISLKNGTITPVDIKTGPYPGFPTDLLPQWVAFMTQATGSTTKEEYSIVHDQIYDGRFNYVGGLRKMKARIDEVNDKEYHIYAGIYLGFV